MKTSWWEMRERERERERELAAHHCMHQESYMEIYAVRNQQQTASAMA